MIDSDTIVAPAGWYDDPVETNRGGLTTQRRWWNGTAWTEHTASIDTPVSPDISDDALGSATASALRAQASAGIGVAPATVSPHDSARTARQMPLHPVASPAAPPAARVSSTPLTGEHAQTATVRPYSYSLRVNAVSIWLMATMPITQALLLLFVVMSLPAETSTVTRALALALPFVLSAALASQDVRLLGESGHLRTAPWLSALVAPPLYLAVRNYLVGRSTGYRQWPLLLWFASQVLVIGVWWLVDPESFLAVVNALS